MSNQYIELEAYMKELKLKGMLANYGIMAEEASKKNLPYEKYLSLLLKSEYERKKDGSIKNKISKAKFPYIKTLEGFDFGFQPHIEEKEIIRLSGLCFIEEKHNVIFLGPPGVGKTHLSIALGIQACMAKYRVVFYTAQKLIEELVIAEKDGSLLDKLLYYSRIDVFIIDELGYMPISKEQANLLFQLVSMRYEKKPLIITSNYSFDGWGNIFHDTVVAAAIIDRIVHHAYIFPINGSSYRVKGKKMLKKEKLEKKD